MSKRIPDTPDDGQVVPYLLVKNIERISDDDDCLEIGQWPKIEKHRLFFVCS